MRVSPNTTSKLVRCWLLTLVPFLAACGSRGDPRPPVYPNPPAIADLTVAQRGASAILRFARPPLTARVGSEDVELEDIEVLVYGERYPLLTVESLLAGLERRRDVMAEDAAAEAAAASARAAVEAASAAGQPPPPDDPGNPATTVRRRTLDEDLIFRVPRDLRDEWRQEGLAADTVLAAAQRLVSGVDTLWARLNLPNTVLPTGQIQPLPPAGEVAEASVPILQSQAYERPLAVGLFLERAAISRRVPVDQMESLLVDDLLQVAIPVGSASAGTLRTRYYFAIRGRSTRRTPGEVTALAALAPAPVPVPPNDVTMEVGPNGVELSWTPPAGDLALRRLDPESIRYNVYRMTTPDDIAGPQPINATPVAEPAYTDGGMQWGETYVYEVRALLVGEGTVRRESEGVKTGAVQVVDSYPPAPPTAINPTRAGRRVTLQWTPSASIDLTGYRIYRHPFPAPEVPARFDPTAVDEATGEPPAPPVSAPPNQSQDRNEMVEAGWVLLTEDPVPFSRYTDADVDPSVRYVYAVEAVDAAGNLSALGVGSEPGDDEP